MTPAMTIPASRLTKHLTITVTVTGMRVWKARWWVAQRLLFLAAWVAGCGLKVDLERAA